MNVGKELNYEGGYPMGGYGCTSGFGGGFGAGLVGGIIGSRLFDHGHGHDYSRHGSSYGGVDNSLAYLVGRDNGLEAKTSDVVAATNAVNEVTRSTGAAIINNLNALDGKVNAGHVAMLQGFNGVDKGICDLRHASDMQFATLGAQAERLACEQKMLTMAETGRVLEALNTQNFARMEDKLEATRFRLNEVERQRDLLATGNFPVSTPAHVEKHCGHSHEDGVDIRINAIGNEVNSLKFQNQQILQALNGIATAGQGGSQAK